ncbi:Curli production assembly/transport component CsgG [Calothrix sp. NIES-4101]|nr:Curli production assembly/transport component CsgG [Calothrix sp. NIES-4101]
MHKISKNTKYTQNILGSRRFYLPVITTGLIFFGGIINFNGVNATEKKLVNISTQKTVSVNIDSANIQSRNPQSKNLKSTSKDKVRIAVLDFDYSSVADYNSWSWYIRGDGKGVSDILVNKLVDSGKYSVIERSKLDAILQEQNLGASGRVDASTAAQIGKLLGVDVVVIGSVTGFNIERDNGGVCAFGVCAGGKKASANVQLNIRMVNTNTGEIIATAEGKGQSGRGDGNLSVRGFSINSNSNKESKLLTLATADAIEQVAKKINADSSQIAAVPKSLPTQEALVADVSGRSVILNQGSASGYRQGMKLSIERVTREVKDPATGKVIRKITQQIGLVELTEVDASSSVGKIISGSTFKVGDMAKPTE